MGYSDLVYLWWKGFRKRMKSKDRDKVVNRAMQYKGEYVRGNGFKLQIEFFNKHLFLAFLKIGFLALIPVIFFCFVAIASAEEATNVTLPISMITSFKTLLTLIILIPVICLVPFFIAFFAFRDKDKWKDYPLAMPKGSVRALLAFSLVVLIAIVLILFGGVNEIITAMLAILASIVGYYFGQRSVGAEPNEEKGAESKEAVNPQVSPKNVSTLYKCIIKSAKEQDIRKLSKDAENKGLLGSIKEATVEEYKKLLEKLSDKALDKLFEDEKPKSSKDFDEKLLHIMAGLLDFVNKKTKEFDEFKVEISDKLEKLEESVDVMIKRP